MKPGVSCLIGSSVPESIVEEQAKRLQCPLYIARGTFSNYEEENRAISRSALEIVAQKFKLQPSSIEFGLQAIPPCRFQQISEEELRSRFTGKVPRGVILDVAHNPDGIRKLFCRINNEVTVVCGFSKDKDVQGCLFEMRDVSAIFFVQAQAPRAMATDELVKLASLKNIPHFAYGNLREGIERAFHHAR